jgi:hypothetical protein
VRNGKRREMGLGPASGRGAVSLVDARDRMGCVLCTAAE